jgi:hypothetical protein
MTEFPARVRAAARLHTDRILRLPNVVGVGVARRRVGGTVTDEPAVLTYVSRKLPLEALRLDERVPRVVDVDGEEVGTDVVEIGVPRFVAVDTAPVGRCAAAVRSARPTEPARPARSCTTGVIRRSSSSPTTTC